MKPFPCLIVDDEPIAREILVRYCSQLPYLKVVATASNALEAKTILQRESISLLFLDINMPVLDGLSFLKTLKNPPQVIFTTAYREYALDAFELSACDYLLKPFSLERFMVAVDKAIEKSTPITAVPETIAEPYIFIKADGKIVKLLFDEILFAEARGNYTLIESATQSILPSISFSAMEAQLPGSIFLRVHRSFIINKAKITHIEGNRVYIGQKEIPIGTNYKENFLLQLGLR